MPESDTRTNAKTKIGVLQRLTVNKSVLFPTLFKIYAHINVFFHLANIFNTYYYEAPYKVLNLYFFFFLFQVKLKREVSNTSCYCILQVMPGLICRIFPPGVLITVLTAFLFWDLFLAQRLLTLWRLTWASQVQRVMVHLCPPGRVLMLPLPCFWYPV